MTHEEVAILWKDANGWDVRGYTNTLEDLERFARLVAAKEREKCAKVFDDRNKVVGFYEPHEPAEIIRAVANNNNPLDGIRTFARAIEAKLKEKNSA